MAKCLFDPVSNTLLKVTTWMLELRQYVGKWYKFPPLNSVLNTKGYLLDNLSIVCMKSMATGTSGRLIWIMCNLLSKDFQLFWLWPTLNTFYIENALYAHAKKHTHKILWNNNESSNGHCSLILPFYSISSLPLSLSFFYILNWLWFTV